MKKVWYTNLKSRRRFESWICQFVDIVDNVIAIVTYMSIYPSWGMKLRTFFIKRNIAEAKRQRDANNRK